MTSAYLIVWNKVLQFFYEGQRKLGQKRLLVPFYKAKNYEIAFVGIKRFLVKKEQGKLCPRSVQI